jgi:hypothetical protein
VSVLENFTDVTDVNGLPPHSIEAIVLGGADADIAQVIYETKAAGTRPHGTTFVNITDSSGNPQAIGFSRPTSTNIRMDVAFDWVTGSYPDNTAAEAAVAALIEAKFTQLQGVGRDVVIVRYEGAVNALNTDDEEPDVITDVTVTACVDPGTPTRANQVVGIRNRAVLTTLNVTGTEVAQNP